MKKLFVVELKIEIVVEAEDFETAIQATKKELNEIELMSYEDTVDVVVLREGYDAKGWTNEHRPHGGDGEKTIGQFQKKS